MRFNNNVWFLYPYGNRKFSLFCGKKANNLYTSTPSAPKFQQADYPISHLDQQFTYVDFADIKWDAASETWKQQSYSK